MTIFVKDKNLFLEAAFKIQLAQKSKLVCFRVPELWGWWSSGWWVSKYSPLVDSGTLLGSQILSIHVLRFSMSMGSLSWQCWTPGTNFNYTTIHTPEVSCLVFCSSNLHDSVYIYTGKHIYQELVVVSVHFKKNWV